MVKILVYRTVPSPDPGSYVLQMCGFSCIRVGVLTSVCLSILICRTGVISIPALHAFKKLKHLIYIPVYSKQYRCQNSH